jgi:hypothetical protein
MNIFRFDDHGRLVEEYVRTDYRSFLRQLGAEGADTTSGLRRREEGAGRGSVARPSTSGHGSPLSQEPPTRVVLGFGETGPGSGLSEEPV